MGLPCHGQPWQLGLPWGDLRKALVIGLWLGNLLLRNTLDKIEVCCPLLSFAVRACDNLIMWYMRSSRREDDATDQIKLSYNIYIYICLLILDLAGLVSVYYAAWSFRLLQSYGCASSKCMTCKAVSHTGTYDPCTNAELDNPATTCLVSGVLAVEFWRNLWFLGVNSRSIWHIRQWRWHVAHATSALPTKETNQYLNLMQRGRRNLKWHPSATFGLIRTSTWQVWATIVWL